MEAATTAIQDRFLFAPLMTTLPCGRYMKVASDTLGVCCGLVGSMDAGRPGRARLSRRRRESTLQALGVPVDCLNVSANARAASVTCQRCGVTAAGVPEALSPRPPASTCPA